MISRRTALGSALTALTTAAIARPASATDAFGAIDGLLRDRIASEHIPGGAFLAVRDGRIIHKATFGVRNREQNLPVTLDTVFPIGSATKSFTAMAAAILHDRGSLSFDDRPHTYLPYFHMADPQADAGVTLTDMLSHRSGLRAYADLAAEPGVLTREDYVRAATSARPEYPFRARFQYSNAMVTAAGEVLGHIAGLPWEKVIERDILAPLGMTSSLATFKDLPRAPDHATGYVYDPAGQAWRIAPPPNSLDTMAPAGAVASSANDMARWLLALTARGKPLVTPATFARLIEPRIPINAAMSYAMCWATYDWAGLKVVEHNGGSEGICALVSFIPDKATGFVFLGNTSPNFLTQIGKAAPLIYPVLLGITPPDAPPVTSKPAPPPADTRAGPRMPAITANDLLASMIEAAGGRDALARHRTLSMAGVKAYENQGVMADYTLMAQASASHEEIELWHAAGHDIGRIRVRFDGSGGAQETTFGQDAENDDATNATMRRDYDFHRLLNLKDLYPSIALSGTGWVQDRPVILLALTAADGTTATLGIDMDTHLTAFYESQGTRTIYSDYRPVDGEQVAPAWEIHDGLGLTSVNWRDIAFDTAVSSDHFTART